MYALPANSLIFPLSEIFHFPAAFPVFSTEKIQPEKQRRVKRAIVVVNSFLFKIVQSLCAIFLAFEMGKFSVVFSSRKKVFFDAF